MLKTAIIASAIMFGAAVPSAQAVNTDLATAEQTILNLAEPDAVIAQFSYLEISHGADGFGLSVTDQTAIFMDIEFPGDLHIRIGY